MKMERLSAILIVLVIFSCSNEKTTTTTNGSAMIDQCFQIDRTRYQPSYYCRAPNCSGIGCLSAGGNTYETISESYILVSQDSALSLPNGRKIYIPQSNWPAVEWFREDTLTGPCETDIIESAANVNFETMVGIRLGCDTSQYLQYRNLEGYELYVDLVPAGTVSLLWSKDESNPNSIRLMADSMQRPILYFNHQIGLIEGNRLFKWQEIVKGSPNWQVLSTMLVLETVGLVYWEQQHIGSENTWFGSESFVRYVADSVIQKDICTNCDSLPNNFPCSNSLIE